MKRIIIKIIAILLLIIVLFIKYSSGKYAYNYEFTAMNLVMSAKEVDPPFTNYRAYTQIRSFILLFTGLSTDVYKITGTFYNKDYPDDVQVKNLIRYSTSENFSFSYSAFRNGINSGRFVYTAKFYDRANNLIYEIQDERDCNL